MLREQTILPSMEYNIENVIGSCGWLDRWKKHYFSSEVPLSGESAEVLEETIQKWKERLGPICSGYYLKDIFNADETGTQATLIQDCFAMSCTE